MKKLAPVARAIRDESFSIKKRSVLAPLSGALYNRILGRHEFAIIDGKKITHTIDGTLCAIVEQHNWEDYVIGNEAAQVACDWVPPV